MTTIDTHITYVLVGASFLAFIYACILGINTLIALDLLWILPVAIGVLLVAYGIGYLILGRTR